jgi:dihydropyrimidinase
VYDRVIKGGTLVTAGGIFPSDLAIQGERIAALGRDLAGTQEIDARGLLVIPGGVDPHVHLEMRTATTRTSEDWASGTLAAAWGGTTTVVDFIEPENGQPLLDALHQRCMQADGHASVDYSLHMTLTQADGATLSQVKPVTAAGITSFKMYTTYAGFALNDQELLRALAHIKDAGAIALVHCENDAIVQMYTNALLAAGKNHPRYHPVSRPAEAEIEAISRVISLAECTGAVIYIVHISTAGGIKSVRRAHQNGQEVYGETCPQYLLLDANMMNIDDPLLAASLVCAPPLRTRQDAAQLWAGLSSGTLLTVGTDHCAFNRIGQKDTGLDWFPRIPGGLPGIEARLPLIYTYGVCTGKLTLEQWVSVCSTNPARILGLYPRKGSLLPGADADIVLFDPDKTMTMTKALLHEQVDYTPYEGMELVGWPVEVILRGESLISDYRWTGSNNKGQFLKRSPRSS